MELKFLSLLFLFSLAAISFCVAIRNSKHNKFYSDTPLLFPLGIFVWGDALVLGPFWMVAAVLFSVLLPLNILRFLLVFFLFRAVYEVVYWINHQVAKKDYRPPLFRKVKWLGANEAAILYQLLNMIQVIFCVWGLILTFVF